MVQVASSNSDQAADASTHIVAELFRELIRADLISDEILTAESRTFDVLVYGCQEKPLLERTLGALTECTNRRHPLYVIEHFSEASSDILVSIATSQNDVVFIRSGTYVSPQWLARLERSRLRDPKLHAVAPLSNIAAVGTLPHARIDDDAEGSVDDTLMQRLVSKSSMKRYPRVPLLNSPCLMMSRQLLQKLGPIDGLLAELLQGAVFWCDKAWGMGFELALCDDTFVTCDPASSFKDVICRFNPEKISSPKLQNAMRVFSLINPLRFQQQRIHELVRRAASPKRAGILNVVHGFDIPSGTELHTRQLLDALGKEYYTSVLYPDFQIQTTDAKIEQEPAGLLKIKLNPSLVSAEHAFKAVAANLTSPLVEQFFAEAVLGSGAEIVHFQHLANFGSLLLPQLAKKLFAKVIISLHDYFLLCPDWNMIKGDSAPCDQSKAEPGEPCLSCLQSKLKSSSPNPTLDLHQYLQQRNSLAYEALLSADLLVAPSNAMRDRFVAAWGNDIFDRITVLPHGTEAHPFQATYQEAAMLRVAFLGNLTLNKGSAIFFEAARRLRDAPLRFKVIGAYDPRSVPTDLTDLEYHGGYQPCELPELLQEVDLAIIPSIWHETFCYTVDEAFRAGVPVIASKVGALAERVVHQQNGWLFSPGNVVELVDALRLIEKNRELLAQMRKNVKMMRLKSRAQNMAEYRSLYRRMVLNHRKSSKIISQMLINKKNI